MHCLIANCEDSSAKTILGRLLATRANLSRVHRIDGRRDAKGVIQPFALNDVEPLRQYMRKLPNVHLVVIDPVASYVAATGARATTPTWKSASLSTPSMRWPREWGTRFHPDQAPQQERQQQGGEHHRQGVSPTAIAAAPVFMAAKDTQDESRRLFLCNGINVGIEPDGQIYRLDPCPASTAEEIYRQLPADWPGEDKDAYLANLARVGWSGQPTRTSTRYFRHTPSFPSTPGPDHCTGRLAAAVPCPRPRRRRERRGRGQRISPDGAPAQVVAG